MSDSEKNLFATRDVSLAAFIKFSGHDLVEFRIVRNGKDGEWVFDVNDIEVNKLKIQYVNSDFAAFEGIRRGMAKQKYG